MKEPCEIKLDADRYAEALLREGYFIREGVLSDGEVDGLRTALALIPDGEEVRRRRGVYGVRNLLEICPEVRELARHENMRQFVTPVLGESAFAVRAIYFDKVPGSNWSLFWHQDEYAFQDLPDGLEWNNRVGALGQPGLLG